MAAENGRDGPGVAAAVDPPVASGATAPAPQATLAAAEALAAEVARTGVKAVTVAREPITSVVQRLFADAPRFAFFQTVRLLRRLAQLSGRGGRGGLAEPVRFRTPLSLAFPGSEVDTIEFAKTESAVRDAPIADVTVNIMGLTGPLGALPRHYTELLIERQVRHRDRAAKDFFDLFSHRLIALFWRAWEKYHFQVGVEEGRKEGFSRYLLDIVGIGTGGLQNRLRDERGGLPDAALAYYSGVLGQRPYSANSIERVLGDFLNAPARLEHLAGQWLRLPVREQTRLGMQQCHLGHEAVLGDRVWDRQSKLRLVVGPVDRRKFDALLPPGHLHRALVEFFRFFAGIARDLEIRVVLRREAVPRCELGGGDNAPLLGWNTWIASGPIGRDADDCVYRFSAVKGV
jgi:type VI secretion system protein ImpH